MKQSILTFGFILGFLFPMSVFASDTLSIKTVPQVPARMVVESDYDLDLPATGNVKSLTQQDGLPARVHDGMKTSQTHESNPLLDFIINYDINASRVYPKPARVILPDEDLDYPEMSPLFMPLVFNAIHRDFKIRGRDKKDPGLFFSSKYLDSLRISFRAENYIRKLAQSILQDSETKQIGIIRYDQKNLPKPEQMAYHLNSSKPPVWLKPYEKIPGRNADTKVLPKSEYSPWSKDGYLKLQFSQTYNSPNWSKGGESNMAGLTTLFLEANYTNFKNVQFDNNVEAKIGINTVNSDSLRNLNISTDQLRMVSKLGIRMYNDWFYSLSGEFTTQFLNNYKANTMTFNSSFLSPAKLFVGLGVDYKKADKKKKYTLSVNLAPMTVKMSYLKDIVNFKPSSYGIEDGRHFGNELGSKVTATLAWTFSEQVQWKSKFYYFTDFSYIDSEWENTVDLNLNHYFTTTIFLHLKLDDRLKRDPGDHLLQMQELLSFGMVYRW